MYLAALTALDTVASDERFALAALEMREIMNNLPPAFGVPKHNNRMPEFDLYALKTSWNMVEKQKRNGTWTGKVNGQIVGFLEEFDEQWNRQERTQTNRRNSTSSLFSQMDESANRAPAQFTNS